MMEVVPVKTERYIVEIGDPRIDEAWCTCGSRFRAPTRKERMVWTYRHLADHLEAE